MEENQFSTCDMEQRFFQGAHTIKVEIQILAETCEDALGIFAANSWTTEEGFQIALTTGLGKMKTERLLGNGSLNPPDEPESLSGRLMRLESMYAVMKYRAFQLMRDNQALEFQNSASRNIISGLEVTVERLRKENLQIRTGIATGGTGAKPALLESARPCSDPIPSPSGPRGLRHALRRLRLEKGHEKG
jgi:hypothetical protein